MARCPQVVLILTVLLLIVRVADPTKCALTSNYGSFGSSFKTPLFDGGSGMPETQLSSEYPTYNDDSEDVNSFLKVLSCSDTGLRAINEDYLRPVNSYKGVLLERVPVEYPENDHLAFKNENYLEVVQWTDSNVTERQLELTFAREEKISLGRLDN